MVLTILKNYGTLIISILSLTIIASCAGLSKTETQKVKTDTFKKNFKNSP